MTSPAVAWAHEARIGRQLDIVHAYAGPGAVAQQRHGDLGQETGDDRADQLEAVATGGAWPTARRPPSTPRSTRWPTASRRWARPRSCSRSTTSPRATSSSGGSPSCPTMSLNGTAGSTADYVNMWHNVRSRFDALGVDNVVWAMNYTGYVTGHCLTKDLWPGNDYVDWVMWDPYPKNALLDRDCRLVLQLPDRQQRRRARLPLQALGPRRVRVRRQQPDPGPAEPSRSAGTAGRLPTATTHCRCAPATGRQHRGVQGQSRSRCRT